MLKIGMLIVVLMALAPSTTLSAQNRELNVNKIEKSVTNPKRIPAIMERNDIPFHSVDVINWEKFPYLPDVKFRIAYTEDAILLHYIVTEATVMALATEDHGPVYKDSCVEFFVSPEEDGLYYNLECNCIGTILFGSGGDEKGKVLADASTMEGIKSWASLGNEPFEEVHQETTWEVAIILPFESFFRHKVETLAGETIRANFYKCGDNLLTRHYVSWNPIGTPRPSFHTPQYFGTIIFDL